MTGEPRDTAVILLQMGGPRTFADVTPFIRAMLSDPAIMDLPAFLRWPLAALIARSRGRRVRRKYQEIGGGSPILEITRRQAEALAVTLAGAGHPLPVLVGMRYTEPSIRSAVRAAARSGARRVVALPLYPHYSHTTTGSAFAELDRCLASEAPGMDCVRVRDWADDQGYVAALAEGIRQALSDIAPEQLASTRVLFSAHGLPERLVARGDPYPGRVAATVGAVAAMLGPGFPAHEVCFQSRVGPIMWIGPDTVERIAAAGREGVSTLVIVPVSFVSEHLETLHEMDIEHRALALGGGISRFIRVPALGDSPSIMDALAGLAMEAMAGR